MRARGYRALGLVAPALLGIGCAGGPQAVGLETSESPDGRTTFTAVRVKNMSKYSFGGLVLEITGRLAMPLADGAGVRLDPFRLERPLTGAVVGPRELRRIPLEGTTVDGRVQKKGLGMALTGFERMEPAAAAAAMP